MKEWSDEIARQLREPLPPEQIGKLPKIPKARQNADKQNCRYCGGWHVPISDQLHVDYVGHVIVNDRLNTIVGQDGWSYTIDRIQEHNGHVVGILATLTIAGVSKQEAGSPGKQAVDWGEEMKLAISDWLPRAAMRFGLGLDVRAKQPLDRVIVDDSHEDRPDTGQAQRRRSTRAPEAAGARPPASAASGSNVIDLNRLNTPAKCKAYIRGQSEAWQARFTRHSQAALDHPELAGLSELDLLQRLIARTNSEQAGEQATGDTPA